MTVNTQMMTNREGRARTHTGNRIKTLGRWTLRLFGACAIIIAILAISGAAYQVVASHNDRGKFPPPGDMVDVGSHQIHMLETGASHDGPTVVLLAGAGSMSAQWAWVQQDVADFARVVSYDRAGLGWSEPSGQPHDARAVASELHTLLKTAEIPGPYVLVGHSLGGGHARVFADLYPDEVAGMVLLDPSSPEFWTEVEPEALDEPRSAASQAKLFPHLARVGMFRVFNPFASATEGLPEQQRKEANAFFASTQHATASRDDYQEILETSATMEALRDLEPASDLPLIVLTRTEPDDVYTGPQQRIDAALAATSNLGSHRIVAGADHITLVTEKEYARQTTDAIQDVLEIVERP